MALDSAIYYSPPSRSIEFKLGMNLCRVRVITVGVGQPERGTPSFESKH